MKDRRSRDEKLVAIEELIAEQDRKDKQRELELEKRLLDPAVEQGIDAYLAPAADAISASIIKLAVELQDRGLITEENPGTARWQADLGTGELVDGIAVEHPDGPRLYSLDGSKIIATRLREDGRYEHALIDSDGLPAEWKTVYQPNLN